VSAEIQEVVGEVARIGLSEISVIVASLVTGLCTLAAVHLSNLNNAKTTRERAELERDDNKVRYRLEKAEQFYLNVTKEQYNFERAMSKAQNPPAYIKTDDELSGYIMSDYKYKQDEFSEKNMISELHFPELRGLMSEVNVNKKVCLWFSSILHRNEDEEVLFQNALEEANKYTEALKGELAKLVRY